MINEGVRDVKRLLWSHIICHWDCFVSKLESREWYWGTIAHIFCEATAGAKWRIKNKKWRKKERTKDEKWKSEEICKITKNKSPYTVPSTSAIIGRRDGYGYRIFGDGVTGDWSLRNEYCKTTLLATIWERRTPIGKGKMQADSPQAKFYSQHNSLSPVNDLYNFFKTANFQNLRTVKFKGCWDTMTFSKKFKPEIQDWIKTTYRSFVFLLSVIGHTEC